MSHSLLRRSPALAGLVLGALLMQAPCVRAQDVDPAAAPVRDVRVFEVRQKSSTMQLAEKGSRIIRLANQIKTIDGFDAEVIRVNTIPGETRQVRVAALKPGVTSMVLVDEHGESYTLEVLVGGDTKHFEAIVKEIFPDSSVKVTKVKETAVIHGWVTQSDQVQIIMDMAHQFYPEAGNYLRVSGDQQVMLHVKMMEVQRGKIRALGFNFLELQRDAFGSSHIGGLTPLSSVSVPFGGPPGLEVNPVAATATFGIVNNDTVFQGFIEALKTESLLKVLAEPTLVAINGRPANFLNGGEFPILVPQGFGTVSVQFRPFGVRLEFVANNVGNGRVRLDVTPEVSERDFTGAVTVGSITIPALTVRRANTQVEMNVGETLIIAGLISNRVQARASKTPFLGELPLIGAAFRRVSYDESETELLIMVTPELAGPITDGCLPHGPGSNTVTPTDRELFGRGYLETLKWGPEPDEYLPSMGGFIGPDMGPGSPTAPLATVPGQMPPPVPGETFFGPDPAVTTPPKPADPVAPPMTRKQAPYGRQSAVRPPAAKAPANQKSAAGTPKLQSPKRPPVNGSRMIQPVSGSKPVTKTAPESGLIAPK